MDHKIIKTVIYDKHEKIKNINLIDRNNSFDLNVNIDNIIEVILMFKKEVSEKQIS